MIEIKGKKGKSIIFERLCRCQDTLGIVFKERLPVMRGEKIFYPYYTATFDDIAEFIKYIGKKYKYICFYSDLSYKEILPFLVWIEEKENELATTGDLQEFYVFYRE
jgi:hypothetical protein